MHRGPGEGCLLCGSELRYSEETAHCVCSICGSESLSTATCVQGHFVCDACHQTSGNEVIEKACLASTCTDPVALATILMRSPAVAMHGPEHHFLVPASLLSAYYDALGRPEEKPQALREARRRGEKVPGGFCGTHGNCGAAVGSGIFWSVVTGARPLSTTHWAECNRLTAQCLLRIAEHGGPRCCKRDTWHAILETRALIGERLPELGWTGPVPNPVCEHHSRNRQCRGAACEFYPQDAHGSRAPRDPTDA